jgi:choline-sulfatase
VTPRPGGAAAVRNILVLLSDQHRYSAGGWAGDPWVQTPHLDALAARGTPFGRAYTPSPLCVPARESLLTGRYPGRAGAPGNAGATLAGGRTFGHLASDAGMATGAVGKMHFLGPDRHRGFATRWDVADYFALEPEACGDAASGMAAPGCYGRYASGLEGSHPDGPNPMRVRDGNYAAGPSPFPAARHVESHITREAIRFMEANRAARWVLWCSYFKPHAPYTPPLEDWARYADLPLPVPEADAAELATLPAHLRAFRRTTGLEALDAPALRRCLAGYYGNVTYLDRQIGAVLGALDALGLREETLIVYSSDHGDMVGDHGLLAKSNFYEASWHIPLIVSHPAHQHGGPRPAALASLIDLLPTLAGAAGLPVPAGVHGVSLLPVVAGERPAVRDHVYGMLRLPRGTHQAAFDGRWKLVRYADTTHLFDLATDPLERHNRIADAPGEAARLAALIDRDAARP